MLKRKIILFVCLALTVSSIASCGSEEDDGKATEPATSVSSVTTEETTIETTAETAPETMTASETTTVATTTAPSAPVTPAWKTAYIDYIESHKDGYVEFALIYVDNDNIPELFLEGNCEAAGEIVCSYKNGQLIELRLGRLHGGRYIERSGHIGNDNGNMGHYRTVVYNLTSEGFTLIYSGNQTEEVILDENGYVVDFVYNFESKGKKVSEEEYYAAFENAMGKGKTVFFYELAVSYDQIRQQISNFN